MKHKSSTWVCISQCGACCRLAPEERLEALEQLSEEQQKEYLSLVASDGWCKFYNKSTKECLIYTKRPDFCKVKNLSKIFKCEHKNNDILAIDFCIQNIKSIYSGRSSVLKRYKKAIKCLASKN